MPDIETTLLKPLDGHPIGATRTFSQTDYNTLVACGAVSNVAAAVLKPIEGMSRAELETAAIEVVRSEMAGASDDDLRTMIQRARDKAADATPLDKMKVDDLKALAFKEEIDLGDATKKDDIIAAIELAREQKLNV